MIPIEIKNSSIVEMFKSKESNDSKISNSLATVTENFV